MIKILTMFILIFSVNVQAKDTDFMGPDSYRGAYFGHVIAGNVNVEGARLLPGESIVQSVSYVHMLKENMWQRTIKVTANLLCKLKSSKNANYYIVQIHLYLSLDGKEIYNVYPAITDNTNNTKSCNSSRDGAKQLPLTSSSNGRKKHAA